MTLTDAQRLRLRIQDQPMLEDRTYYGDGQASVFTLAYTNVSSASAYVSGSAGWTGTGATFNPTGNVAFSGVISANSAFRVTYTYSTFADAEIDQFLADGGGLAGASREACVALMFDATKRARWMAPDGSQFDDTIAMGHLRDMYKELTEEIQQAATLNGVISSWGLSQGDW